jgi:hypothetical protein
LPVGTWTPTLVVPHAFWRASILVALADAADYLQEAVEHQGTRSPEPAEADQLQELAEELRALTYSVERLLAEARGQLKIGDDGDAR